MVSLEYEREDREDAPFLAPEPAQSSSTPGRPQYNESKPAHSLGSDASIQKIGFRLKVTLFAMILAVDIGFSFIEGPQVRIFESIACRQFFSVTDPSQIGANGQVPEAMCKGAEVQAELAAVKGYNMFFDGLLCMLRGLNVEGMF